MSADSQIEELTKALADAQNDAEIYKARWLHEVRVRRGLPTTPADCLNARLLDAQGVPEASGLSSLP